LVSQIALIAQTPPLVAPTVLLRPHAPSPRIDAHGGTESQLILMTQENSGPALKTENLFRPFCVAFVKNIMIGLDSRIVQEIRAGEIGNLEPRTGSRGEDFSLVGRLTQMPGWLSGVVRRLNWLEIQPPTRDLARRAL